MKRNKGWPACLGGAALLATMLPVAGVQAADPAFVPDRSEKLAALPDLADGATPWTRAPEVVPDIVRFAVIGDRTGLARPGVFERGIRQAANLAPDFVINVGDLIEGYTSDEAVLDADWKEMHDAIDAADIPFFFVAGNHDLGNEVMLKKWRQLQGNPYYAFRWKGALFLILDTEDPPLDMPADFAAMLHETAKAMQADPVATEKKMAAYLSQVNDNRHKGEASDKSMEAMKELEGARISPGQLSWALDVLQRHEDARWTFLLMHKPAWKLGSEAFAKIEQAIAGRNYTVIAGHNHYYDHERRHGRDYLTMGTAGGITHQAGSGQMDHLAWVVLDGAGPTISLLKLNGILDIRGESHQPYAK